MHDGGKQLPAGHFLRNPLFLHHLVTALHANSEAVRAAAVQCVRRVALVDETSIKAVSQGRECECVCVCARPCVPVCLPVCVGG